MHRVQSIRAKRTHTASGVGAPQLKGIFISRALFSIPVYIHQNYQRVPVESIQKYGTGSSLISTKDACIEELPG